jgi:hypothetical protein
MKKWKLAVLSVALLGAGCLEMPLWSSRDKASEKAPATKAEHADAAPPAKPKVKPEDVTTANARQMADALEQELAETPANKRP